MDEVDLLRIASEEAGKRLLADEDIVEHEPVDTGELDLSGDMGCGDVDPDRVNDQIYIANRRKYGL